MPQPPDGFRDTRINRHALSALLGAAQQNGVPSLDDIAEFLLKSLERLARDRPQCAEPSTWRKNEVHDNNSPFRTDELHRRTDLAPFVQRCDSHIRKRSPTRLLTEGVQKAHGNEKGLGRSKRNTPNQPLVRLYERLFTNSVRKNSQSVTSPTAWCVPRSVSLITVSASLSTQ